MRDMKLIMADPQLYSEFVKAYKLAGPYRERLQLRRFLFEISTIHDDFIYSHSVNEMMVDALSGYINPALKEG